MTRDGEELRFDWRRGGAAAAGLFAALVLVVMVFLVKFANDAREHALTAERHSYDVALVVRNVSSNMSRAEAALARFVLDEDQQTSGAIYSSDWGLAGYQIQQLEKLMRGNPEQQRRVAELEQLYRKRDGELALAARAAHRPPGPERDQLFLPGRAVGHGNQGRRQAQRDHRQRAPVAPRQDRAEPALLGPGRPFHRLSELARSASSGSARSSLAWSRFRRFVRMPRRARQAESESERAEVLEIAVRERTQELWEANQALKAEAAEREAAEAQLRQVQKMEAVGQLTGGIAHDFNNMLAVVVGGIDLALRRLNGPRREVMIHLNNAMEGATRAAALTRRLLSFARSEPLLPERVDSSALIGGMSDLLDRTLGRAHPGPGRPRAGHLAGLCRPAPA